MDEAQIEPQDIQAPPVDEQLPQAGGSYLRDEKTGELTLIHRTKQPGEA